MHGQAVCEHPCTDQLVPLCQLTAQRKFCLSMLLAKFGRHSWSYWYLISWAWSRGGEISRRAACMHARRPRDLHPSHPSPPRAAILTSSPKTVSTMPTGMKMSDTQRNNKVTCMGPAGSELEGAEGRASPANPTALLLLLPPLAPLVRMRRRELRWTWGRPLGLTTGLVYTGLHAGSCCWRSL